MPCFEQDAQRLSFKKYLNPRRGTTLFGFFQQRPAEVC